MKRLISVISILTIVVSLFSWQLDRQAQFPVNLYSIDRAGNNVVIGGGSGGVGHSTDNGETFSFVMTPTFNASSGVYNDANDVSFADENHVAIASEDGMVIISDDGGATWTQAPGVEALFGTDDTEGIVYHADGKIWVSGANGKIAYSEDHGQTWVLQTTPGTDTLYKMSMNSSGTGFVACNNGSPDLAKLYKTTDYGQNWEVLALGTPNELTNFAVEQYGSLVVVVGDDGSISYSNDNGANWTHHIDLSGSRLTGVSMNGAEGYAVGWNGVVVKTTDSWETVQVVENDWNYYSQDIIYDANDHAMLAGWYGTVAKSTDGITWVEKTVSSVDNYNISLIDEDNWYLIGDKGTIFKTTDGGSSYDKIFIEPYNNLDINTLQTSHFFDMNEGIVTGKTSGVVYKTTNGGDSWTSFQIPGVSSSKTMYAFEFLNDQVGWTFGYASVAAKTTNGGDTWNPLTLSGITTNDNIYCAHAFDENNIVLGAKNGVIYRTNDGQSFTSITIGSTNINDIYFQDADHGIAVNTAGDIYYTTNGGLTAGDWMLASESADDDLNTIYEADNGTLVVGGYSADSSNLGTTWAMMQSEDNGATWTEIDLPETTFNPVRIMDITGWDNNIIAVGKNQVVYTGTVDGDTPPPPEYAEDLFFSEYIEGSSNNKALEIFNGTGQDIDLTPYVVKLGSNGNDWGNEVDLEGTLAHNDVFIIANDAAVPAILDISDVTSNVTWYNGDDAIGLFLNDTLIDVIGVYQTDPGTAWDVAGVTGATLNHTLVRKPDVVEGTTDWTASAGTDTANSQWLVYDIDEFSYIGFHEFAGGSGNNVAMPTFDPAPGSYDDPINVTLASETPDASIYYTLDGSEPTDTSTMYSGPINVSESTTIKAIAYADGLDPSFVATGSYTILTVQNVANVAELRNGNTDGSIYNLTSEVIATFVQTYRNQKYIQDTTAGILIDDNNNIITTAVSVGDGITGIQGTLSVYNGMLQFTPVQDIASVTSTGNVVEPVVVTIPDLVADFDTYEARVVAVENVQFATTGEFTNGTAYEITDGTNTYNFRSTFYDVDYIGTAIPAGIGTINVIPNSRVEGEFITARTLADFDFGPITNPAPTNLSYEVNDDAVTLTWEAPTDATNLTAYKVYKDDAFLAELAANILTYTDEDLADGDYTYYVTAMYGDDESLASNTVMVYIGEATGDAEDLFISEYIEGSSNNKAIEIFNGTGIPVDLTPYVVKSASNGGEWNNDLNLEGTLANGDVFVIANSAADPAILNTSDATSAVTYFNGNDAIGLFLNDVMIDAIGVYQTDPGTAWNVAGVENATLNHTLVRKPTVIVGNLDWTASAGTNADDSEWIVYDIDELSYIGSHEFTGGTPGNNAATPVFDPASGTYDQPISVTMTSETEGATIYYTIDGTEPTDASPEYTGAIDIEQTTTVKARAYADGMDPSYIATANYTIITLVEVSSVSELRAGATDGTIYNLTSEVIVTFAQDFRNQKYIQDDTAGILIDDYDNVIATAYSAGDAVTGLFGTLTEYGNMLQFTPTQAGPTATSTGNIVNPLVVTINDLMTDFDTYESRVIKLNNVMFSDTGAFANGTSYGITDGTDNFNFRTTFYDVDYIGNDIPIETGHIIAIPNARTDGNYITSRNNADLLFDGVNPPENLTAVVVEGGVMLNWDTVVENLLMKAYTNELGEIITVDGDTRVVELRNPDGWKVYRNDFMIAEADDIEYLDPVTEDGVYTYYVTAMYGQVESAPSNTATVTIGDPGAVIIEDSFETYPDFALEFGAWTLVDVDQSTTYGIQDVEFDNSGSPMSYIIFNPSATVPALTDNSYIAADGDKYAVAFASTTPSNNDWMITPAFAIDEEADVTFQAKSITDQYGLERFNVLVSTGSTNPEDFSVISGEGYIQAPLTWTDYSYNLDEYAGQTIRIAIQCVSDDAFMFMLDNFKVTAPNGTGNSNDVNVVTTELVGNYPNPFNPETRISFLTKENGPVSIDIYNIKGQRVRSLLNENREAGVHNVVWNGKDDKGKNVASGVFFYRMKSGQYTSTKKMILMK